jgi:hypothetical protein
MHLSLRSQKLSAALSNGNNDKKYNQNLYSPDKANPLLKNGGPQGEFTGLLAILTDMDRIVLFARFLRSELCSESILCFQV